ncbi:MAG: TraB/GumN family protein [Alphaproteobacteria bacterium]
MRRLILIVLSLFLWPQLAAAQATPGCAGADLLAELEAADPTAHADLFERAHAVPNGRGKFWRVSRPGTIDAAPPSYLFGTFHDTAIARLPLDPAVARALAAARLMLVELTGEEQARMQARIASDPEFILDAGATGLSGQLTGPERAAAERKLAENGLTLAIADKLRPWMLFSLLAVPQCMLREMQQGEPLLDTLLASRAAEAGVPVAGLETYQQALGGFDAIPADTMNMVLLEGLRSIGREEDFRRTSVDLYLAGEIAAIWEFSVHDTAGTTGMARSHEIYAQFAAALIDARNLAWMDVLAPQLARGGVFAAFGALHLPGEAGVIELLRARGFEVTRLDG